MNAGNRRRRLQLRARGCDFLSSMWRCRRLSRNSGWPEQWRSPEPKPAYDVVIVGAGGHGLATAYYLAKEHGISNVAVLEKGWLGGGNTGRNTTIIRSNYLWEESAALYEHALKLWEGLSQELNYNVMYSPRGVHDARAQPPRRAGGQAPRPRQSPQRHRQRMADAGGGEGVLPDAQHRPRHPLSGARRGAAAARRHGAPRRGRLGLCARGRRARRRHHRELRGDRRSAATLPARSTASRRRAARSRPRRSASSPPAIRRS